MPGNGVSPSQDAGGLAGALEVAETGGLTGGEDESVVVGPWSGVGLGLEVVGLLVAVVFRIGGGLVGVWVRRVAVGLVAGFGLAPGTGVLAGTLEGFGVAAALAALAGDGSATTRAAKGTRMAGVTCGGDAVLLFPP